MYIINELLGGTDSGVRSPSETFLSHFHPRGCGLSGCTRGILISRSSDEIPFYVLVVPGYKALAAADHVKVFLRIDVINS